MKTALVIGASGGMGYALVNELVGRNIQVKAFARNKEKLDALFQHHKNVEIISGDAFNEQEMMRASNGVDVIFHAISFPYENWEKLHIRCLDMVINIAERQGAKIALVDNIYAYGRQSTNPVIEQARKEPQTKKGKIRLTMENKLKDSNVPSLIVHFPDLYGPNAENTILYETLKNVTQGKKANFVGNMQVEREFLYTVDAAKAMVELALRDDTYNQNWNVPAVHPIAGEQLIKILREITDYKKGIRTVSKGMVQMIGIFSPSMREVVEILYLTEEPVILSGEKYEKEIGALPRTSYRVGLEETILWMNKRALK
ncbi:SDR family NAD(P)-dependent oxidoreductase [Lysinibacillus agricola]|uniref:SDR family NAD(P)-dependent oxidoreductase n=1 Tax=Lysinibacillus agricola TaxID=2590012 RepID=A0ABX7AN95_9BACI|nr:MULTISPECIES: SDR family NAD(P)-dependent oxidoreductase [Lysinibacillus]KOS62005.1 NADH-ubiquinone oxidoreductase [Lysinibacillus sp. FJAT-14222]QQP11397.1 SDR family NAD(P)-dependent oxidoreductase [Lysinibacillus agricola]